MLRTPPNFEIDGHHFHLEPWQLSYLNDFLTPFILITVTLTGIVTALILLKYRKHFAY